MQWLYLMNKKIEGTSIIQSMFINKVSMGILVLGDDQDEANHTKCR